MNSLYQRKIQKRTIMMIFFFMLWFSGLVLRLIQLQIIDHPHLKAEVVEQNRSKNTITPQRGTIYDCKGNILARSIPRDSVFYQPSKDEPYEDQLKKIKKLKRVLNLSKKKLQIIKTRIERNDPFIWIKRKIDPDKAGKIRNMALSGIHLMKESKRFYPQGKLASHILGRVDIDDFGQSGIEYKYNSVLEGKKGERIILRDAKRRGYRLEILKKPEAGKDLILTIDETIQYIAEKELEKAILKSRAKWGTVIISQPLSGEILAMANYPAYDLNNPPSIPSNLDRNRAIHHTFDPGSTFKIITASAALESGQMNFDDAFDCSKGAISLAGKTIRDYQRFGILSFPEVIIHSSNVGTIQIGQRVGEEILYNTIRAFGFGKKTGIDLPAEEKGIFRSLNDWTKISVASHSIGYEISVTAMQLLQALNIIANKGVITTPAIVKKTMPSPNETKIKIPEYKRIISEETASKLIFILQKAVQEGTGLAAQIDGYKVAGKTGTAQKFNPSIGGYSTTLHMASFMGFVLVERPIISIIVVLDAPKGKYYGGQVAAPVFRDITTQVLRYLHIPPHKEFPETVIAAKQGRQVER